MKNKRVEKILIVLLVLSILSLSINVQIAKANPAIVINPDGSVDPPTAPIQRDGDLYTFTADIYDSIEVQKSDIVIDGNNFKIQGPGSYGIAVSPEAYNTTIQNVLITGFSQGIYSYSAMIVVKRNVIINCGTAIRLEYAWAAISENIIVKNSVGIGVYETSANISNNIIANDSYAIDYLYSANNNWINNTIANSTIGIAGHYLSSSSILGNKILNSTDTGIILYDALDNTISRNSMEHNNLAIKMYGFASEPSGNNISDNTFAYNEAALTVTGANNFFYHNNFLSNVRHVDYAYGFNYWDDGYPSGGNFWSDYNGVDIYGGPGQNITGSDGIGDTPYFIAQENVDRYPLMIPYNTTEFLVLRITSTLGGTTNPAAGPYVYSSGAVVEVTAVPEADYMFDYWELDNINMGAANPISLTIDTNHALKAVFKLKPDIAVTSIVPYPTNVRRGQLVYVNVTVTNQRFTSETFDVVVYADTDRNIIGDEITVGVQTVYNLQPGGTKTITFTWDTSTLQSGTGYYISAKAIVPYDIDPSNNLLTAKKKVTVRC